MNRKFRGRFPWKGRWNWWQLLLIRLFCFWCAIDLLIVPIFFAVHVFLMRKKRRGRRDKKGAGMVRLKYTPVTPIKMLAKRKAKF